MKNLKPILVALFLGVIFQINTIYAQDYLQFLDTVQINMETENSNIESSYIKFNDKLVADENFRFNKAIRHARKEDSDLFKNESENNSTVKKAHYLSVLRKAANTNKTLVGFENTLTEELPEISAILKKNDETNELYKFSRSKTVNGKLDEVGNNLSWL